MVKELNYDIRDRIGDVEIRQYPKHVIAVVENKDDNEAFGYLFRYISGENMSKEKIEMTAPVLSSQKIEMTAPVIKGEGFFAFILPVRFTLDMAPRPSNPIIHLVEKKTRTVAVIRFRGRAGQNQVERKTKELLSILVKNDKKILGKPYLMRYNPPFIPGFLRRNEIAVDIK